MKIIKIIENMKLNLKKIVKILIIVILVIILINSVFVVIPAGHVGVRTVLGAVQGNTLMEGLHIKIPFVEKIIKLDCRIQKTEVTANAASKDLQTINVIIAVNYRVKREIANKLYGEVGLRYEEVLISPAISEAIKSVTAQYTAEETITKRVEVSNNMKVALAQKIEDNGFEIIGFNIVNLDFSDAYNSAIEKKQIAEQQAKQAEYELDKAKIDNERKIEEAKANAEVMKLQNQEITDKTLQLRAIEKWNGVLPTTVLDEILPFLNIKG